LLMLAVQPVCYALVGLVLYGLLRLPRVRPFVPLLILTLTCDLVLILCQGSGSLVYRLTEGQPLTWEFIRRGFDLSSALPPQSTLLYAQFFSGLEEVAFRGVFLATSSRLRSPPTGNLLRPR